MAGNMATRIVNIQCAAFYEGSNYRPDSFGIKLNESLDNLFDAMPTSFALPPGAPVEIPAHILNSESKIYSCNISRIRSDFYIQGFLRPYSSKEFYKIHSENIMRYYNTVLSIANLNRLGFVSTFIVENDSPVTTIFKRYIKDKTLGSVSELFVRYNNRLEISKLGINNITEVRDAVVKIENLNEYSGILVVKDINTVGESKIIDLEFINTFLRRCSEIISDANIQKAVM